MESMLHSGKYADFHIVCKSATFPVHKIVLALECDFFRVMFDSGVKVSSSLSSVKWLERLMLSQESQEGIANFPEDDPEAMGTILHYLYTG